MSRIGIIGAGSVGQSLACGWSAVGHDITVGVRDVDSPSSVRARGALPDSARIVPLDQAGQDADVVVLAVPFVALEEILPKMSLSPGVVLVDATNAFRFDDEGPTLASTDGTSAAEHVARLVPGIQVVKAFNTVGAEHLTNASEGLPPVDIFIAGDAPVANAMVARLAEDLGLRPITLGPLRDARLTEALAIIWIRLATLSGRGRGFSIQVVER
ncbi:NADPH-dependent F420 reductase [Flindersiella endophytica]